MNKNLRKEIIKELKFFLNEQLNNMSTGALAYLRKMEEQNLDELSSMELNRLKAQYGIAKTRDPYIANHFPKITNLLAPQESSKAPERTEAPEMKELPITISCKRCKGVGMGCSGANVKEVQDILIKLGFIKETNQELNDSKFGQFTESAVKAFQAAKKLKPDGIVGQKTCIAMGLIKPATKKPAVPTQVTTIPKEPTPERVGGQERLPPMQESKTYYNTKKLNEAKKLFGRLIKSL